MGHIKLNKPSLCAHHDAQNCPGQQKNKHMDQVLVNNGDSEQTRGVHLARQAKPV